MMVIACALASVVVACAQPGEEVRGAALLRQHAELLRPLVESEPARAFLDATGSLPGFKAPTCYLNAEKRSWLTEERFHALPEAERAGYKPVPARPMYYNRDQRRWATPDELNTVAEADRAGYTLIPTTEDRYYQTRYGSPLVYARPLDLAAAAGLRSFAGARIADYGYGTIGHLRLLASLGADATGIDVDPALPAMYGAPGDTGEITAPGREQPGRITLVNGQWPGGEGIAAQVGGGFDLFISKNTLKNGYIHPEQEVDPNMLVHLGVPDAEFVRAVHGALKPGGLFLIYNLSPRPAKEGEKYIPWADGRCPFPRPMLEEAGFEVLAFDQNDDEAARGMFEALGYPTNADDGGENLFAHYTIARRK